MKKLFCILSVLAVISPVFAEDNPPVGNEDPEITDYNVIPEGLDLPSYSNIFKNGVATASYVKGAYDTMDYLKENRLNDKTLSNGESATNGDVIHNVADYTANGVTAPAKPFVSALNASNGAVTVVNTEVSVPIGSYANPTGRAPIWVD